MALYTFDNINIEISSLQYTPQAIFRDQTTSFSVTMKNKTGVKITQLYIDYLYVMWLPSGGAITKHYMVYGAGTGRIPYDTISWNTNTEKTFTVDLMYDFYPQYIPTISSDNRLINSFSTISFTAASNSESFQDTVRLDPEDGLKIIYEHWQPQIDLFSTNRCLSDGTQSDDGINVSLTAKISHNSAADVTQMTCRLYYAQGLSVDTTASYIDLTGDIIDLIDGVTDDPTFFAGTFSNSVGWAFMLVYGDTYETVRAYSTIVRSFANVHMSGASTGGVAFGKFSASTEGNPLFECEYPAVFNGGVGTDSLFKTVTVTYTANMAGAGNYPNVGDAVLNVDCGAGWTPVYVVGYRTSASLLYPWKIYIENDPESENYKKLILRLRYTGTTTTGTHTSTVNVLCVHTNRVVADIPADYPPINIVTQYVTGEVPTGAKWIDGKQIYRYIVVANNVTEYDNNNPLIGILPSAPETVISIRGMFRYPHSTYPGWRPLPYAAVATNQLAMISIRENTREIFVGWGAASIYNVPKTVIAILEYTKATT